MRAGVQHDSRVGLYRAERFGERLEVKGAGLVVRDGLDVKTDVPKLGVMDGPRRVRDVNGIDRLINLSEGQTCNEEGAGARQGLAGCDLRYSLTIISMEALWVVDDYLPLPPSVPWYL